MKQIKFDVNLPVAIFKEGNTYIAHTPVLDLATSANTFEKAQQRFVEAVEIFFEELEDTGTLDEVLSSLGWRKIMISNASLFRCQFKCQKSLQSNEIHLKHFLK
ncbi:hypothetical protein HY468_05270 [Candidatus Roizmanbacteria bacterium]|nr:hypothetical protein [Candidatus Roizmanbacteria bacterium]